ncbi:MAG: DUF2922 domain-containing protein [Clostridioides sp.]|jgi:hypothetical protein|nr:DUF2922 domain-containing protein [Clostridioides sp.]
MVITKKIMLGFKDAIGKSFSISLDSPKSDLTDEQVKNCMQLILDKNIIKINENELVALKSAKVVQTAVDKFNLE